MASDEVERSSKELLDDDRRLENLIGMCDDSMSMVDVAEIRYDVGGTGIRCGVEIHNSR